MAFQPFHVDELVQADFLGFLVGLLVLLQLELHQRLRVGRDGQQLRAFGFGDKQ